jgi:hypothetical protein
VPGFLFLDFFGRFLFPGLPLRGSLRARAKPAIHGFTCARIHPRKEKLAIHGQTPQ